MLPNCASPIIAVGSLLIGTAILIESGLAFLGLGDPNVMSGADHQRRAGGPAIGVVDLHVSGIAILLTVLGINLVGDGLNEALNPRLRER